MKQETPKHLRLQVILDYLQTKPPARSSLEAYKIFTDTINEVEDEFLGKESYNPPKTFLDGSKTERIYMTNPESFHNVPAYGGVQVLIHFREITFISRYGAIEIQRKVNKDKLGSLIPFKERNTEVIFKKLDAWGDDVWHDKNK